MHLSNRNFLRAARNVMVCYHDSSTSFCSSSEGPTLYCSWGTRLFWSYLFFFNYFYWNFFETYSVREPSLLKNISASYKSILRKHVRSQNFYQPRKKSCLRIVRRNLKFARSRIWVSFGVWSFTDDALPISAKVEAKTVLVWSLTEPTTGSNRFWARLKYEREVGRYTVKW